MSSSLVINGNLPLSLGLSFVVIVIGPGAMTGVSVLSVISGVGDVYNTGSATVTVTVSWGVIYENKKFKVVVEIIMLSQIVLYNILNITVPRTMRRY